MDWILITIVVLPILSTIWFIVQYKRDKRKNQQIFDEYLEQQRKVRFDSRRGLKSSKEDPGFSS
jgi:hypothetical protein